MSILKEQLTFEGGVNLDADPHLLKNNEWQQLQNLWPYSNKLLGSRPSLLHEQDILPVPGEHWDGRLFLNTDALSPTAIKYYGQWFRHLTPLKAIFIGELAKVALVCVCNASNKIQLREHFEGKAEVVVTLQEGDVILMLTPNDLQTGDATAGFVYPTIAGVRLGQSNNLTPSLAEFNGDIIAANKGCEYVVKVVKKASLDPAAVSATVWPGIDYRFTKVDFGATNLDFRADGFVVYKNRFVYWKGNKLWFSDPFQPGLIYEYAVETAYLGVFFDTGLTEDITALASIYMTSLEEAGTSVLAIWTQHGMLFMQGEPATTIASTPEELFALCKVTTVPLTSGCVSGASIVKTKYGMIWCGAESVWFMARGNLPIEVGLKIGPRIAEQSFESAGRLFATFDDNCYRLVINKPGVGYNPFTALNEMWCLSFNGDSPTKENAAWFGPQVFTNTDNPILDTAGPGGEPGLFCCAKLSNINDDKTWYIQPYSCLLGGSVAVSDSWGTRLGLASISTYMGVDITAPFRQIAPLNEDTYYYEGDMLQYSRGKPLETSLYHIEYVVTSEGDFAGSLVTKAIYVDELAKPLISKRPMIAVYEQTDPVLLPAPYEIALQSGNLTFNAPELKKLISGFELTFKTLNPISISAFWWPWEPNNADANVVVLDSPAKIPIEAQNVMGGLFNEPVLTARRIPAPATKRYNGLTAQLNLQEAGYKIVTRYNPSEARWNKLRISLNGTTWFTISLFDVDANTGIAKYQTLVELFTLLGAKVLVATGKTLAIDTVTLTAVGLKFTDDSPLYIDLTYPGWAWFGFVPTNLNTGFGVDKISNNSFPTSYLYSTGPVSLCTPHSIHLAKLSVRYKIFQSNPR